MKTFSYTITDDIGIHARPAGLLVNKVKETGCEVIIKKGEKSANASRLFAIMGLGVTKGDTIDVSVAGEGEASAANELEAFFKNNL